jgi:hypothetical protein
MKNGLILTALMLSLLAFAGMMRIKTDVQTMDRERLRLVKERAQLRETKRVLEAEWALLASPERLQEIANQAGKTYFNGSALSQISLQPAQEASSPTIPVSSRAVTETTTAAVTSTTPR